MNGILLWIAQGFGIGRIPFAPGTFGSLLGLVWLDLLLLPRNPWWFTLGTLAGIAISVWSCQAGERLLQQKDPGSIVIDEIAALPVCFAGWVALVLARTGAMPPPEYFVGRKTWALSVAVFVAFRILDIWKPWPVRQSQALRGGAGVTADDVLAAIYVNILLGVVLLARTVV
jgi:phosphatidylglycerophosphatase A